MDNTITLPISKKVLKVRAPMSVKEVTTARSELNALLQVVQQVEGKEPTQEQVAVISSKTQRQDEIIAEVLLKRFDITQAELDDMPYADALYAYNKLLEITQTIPKN